MNHLTIHEPSRETPVLADYDVVVCGGGAAGCAAAIGAARHGARTLLVEKDGYLGGLTTTAMVCVILSTNGVDFQGIWHDYIRALRRRRGVGGLTVGHAHMSGMVYPEAVKFAWDDLLTQAGVDLLHHVHAAGALVEGGAIRGVLAETRAGRQAILAGRVVDCTGHGIVCHMAGVEWEQGDGHAKWAMALTKVFRMANVKWQDIRFDEAAITRIGEQLGAAIDRGEFVTPTLLERQRFLNYVRGKCWDLGPGRGQVLSVLSRVLEVDPLDPWDFTRAEREGRAQAWEAAEAYRRFVPGCEEAYLLDTAAHVGVRSTRRVKGLARVTDDDAWNLRRQPNSIARSSWDIDVWPATSFSRPAVRRDDADYKERHQKVLAGGCFDIPYGCIVAAGIDNLLMAGQCVSASHMAESSLRIQQTCMATGEAAGVAAALSLKAGTSPRELAPERVVAQLEKDRDVEPAFDVLKGRIPTR